jgi:hypothetical protein
MRRKAIIVFLAAAFAFGAVAPVAFGDPPGPGNSRNGKCVGNPDDRLGGCR